MLCASSWLYKQSFATVFWGLELLALKPTRHDKAAPIWVGSGTFAALGGDTAAYVLVLPTKVASFPNVFTSILLGQVRTRPPTLCGLTLLMVEWRFQASFHTLRSPRHSVLLYCRSNTFHLPYGAWLQMKILPNESLAPIV